jgi:hypothetical protein
VAEPARGSGKALRAWRTIRIAAILPAGWALLRWLDSNPGHAAYDWIYDAVGRVLAGFPAAEVYVWQVLQDLHRVLFVALGMPLSIATFGIPIAFIARMVARARVRAGARDPLDRLRAWTAAHPHATRALLALPALFFAWLGYRHFSGWNDNSLSEYGGPVLLGALFQSYVARAAVRAFLAPTVEDGGESKVTIADDEIRFDAVAVTRETQLAVAAVGMPALPLVVWIATRPIAQLFRDPHLFWLVATYTAFALGSALLFQRASRVAVGIDGVRVYGTSRTRFFAYKSIDDARVEGGDVVLVRKDRVVLRLQLHGEDATRRDAIVARIQAHVADARDTRAAGAQRFVETKTREEVARAAMGGGDYRAPSVTRDQLWQLVEGPTTDANARTAAAEALARAIEPGEQARLRVAAERCAEPRVRVALEKIARVAEISDDHGALADAPPPGAARVRTATGR